MLTDKLRAEILISLSDFKLIEENVWRNHRWTEAEVEFLNFCLKQKHLSVQDFKEAVERRILEIGFEMYKQTTPSPSIRRNRVGEYADHVTSPHALAFAISHKKFSLAQLSAIRFDHGHNPETFMKGRIDTLVEDIVLQLMEHAPAPQLIPDDAEFCHHD